MYDLMGQYFFTIFLKILQQFIFKGMSTKAEAAKTETTQSRANFRHVAEFHLAAQQAKIKTQSKVSADRNLAKKTLQLAQSVKISDMSENCTSSTESKK